MSPERARVFVAEDNERWQSMIQDLLEDEGHSVILSAGNLEEAMAAVERLNELGVQVATLDGNLNEHDTSGYDGQSVLNAIRAKAPKVKTVGLSILSVPGVDVDLGKDNCVDLGKVVKEL